MSPNQDPKFDGELDVEQQHQTRRPRRYRVTLLNDDYTTMEFVVEVLIDVFGKSHTEATQIMLNVHYKGHGVCGVYTREVAETKVHQVIERARAAGFPLLATMEPVE